MRNHVIAAIVSIAMLMPGVLPAEDLEKNDDAGNAVKIDKVVVTGTKTDHRLADVPVETMLITREEIEHSNAKSISSLLSRLPGFNFAQQSDLTGAMGYNNTVRGLNVESRYMLVLVDGQRVFTGYHSGGMASAGFSHNVNVVPVVMVERIEVVMGPGSALYGGDAVVGVLNIITRKPSDETEAVAGGSAGAYEVHGHDYLGNKATDTSRRRNSQYALIGGPVSENIKAQVSLSREANEGIHPETYDIYRNFIQGRIEATPTENLTIEAGAEYTAWEEQQDDIGSDKTETSPRIWLGADYQMAPMHRFNLNAYSQGLDADFVDTLYGIQTADVNYRDVELQYTGAVAPGHLVTAGAEHLVESLDTGSVTDQSIKTTSAYLQDEWELMDGRMILVPGVRFDDNEVYGQEWNPKFSMMYKPGQYSTLRASVGRAFKAPTAIQSSAEPINHVVAWVMSNPDLEPETSVTWQVGLEQGFFERRLICSATYYRTRIEDMITTGMGGGAYLGLPVIIYQNLEAAKIQGIEATADWSLREGLNLGLTYAYTDAENDDTGERLVNSPEHSGGIRFDYAPVKAPWGGAVALFYNGEQYNNVYTTYVSEKTESFTTVNLNLWADILDGVRMTLQADNLFDEWPEGSGMIYAGRSVMLKLEMRL